MEEFEISQESWLMNCIGHFILPRQSHYGKHLLAHKVWFDGDTAYSIKITVHLNSTNFYYPFERQFASSFYRYIKVSNPNWVNDFHRHSPLSGSWYGFEPTDILSLSDHDKLMIQYWKRDFRQIKSQLKLELS